MLRTVGVFISLLFVFANLLGCAEASLTKGAVLDAISSVNKIASLKFETLPDLTANVCAPLSLRGYDSLGVNAYSSEDIAVTLNTLENAQYYSDENCATPLTSVTYPKNSTYKMLYVKATAAQTLLLSGSFKLGELDMLVSTSVKVIAAAVGGPVTGAFAKVSMVGPDQVSAGACVPYILVTTDITGATVNVSENKTFNLNVSGIGTIYSDVNCLTAGATLQIAKDESNGFFYFKSPTSTNTIFVASGGGVVASSLHYVAVKDATEFAPSQLVVEGTRALTKNICSSPFVVKTVNSGGVQSAVKSVTTINLSGQGAGAFYSTPDCSGTPIASISIPVGSSSQSFYYSGGAPESLSFVIDDEGPFTAASWSLSVYDAGGSVPVKFALSGPSSTVAGVCSTAFTLKALDGSNAESGVTAPTTVNLTGLGSGTFHTASDCSGAGINSILMNSGEFTKVLYYKSNVSETLAINADDPGILSPVVKVFSIISAPTSKIVLSGPSSFSVGECKGFSLALFDTFNNLSPLSASTAISLSGGSFYSDSSCSASLSSVAMTAGQSSQLVFAKAAAPGSFTYTAANGTLTNGSLAVTVANLIPSQLAMSAPNTLVAGGCLVVDLSLKNSLGGVSSLNGSALTVNLAKGASSGAFYSGNACAGGPITSAEIPDGSSSLQVSFKNNVAESVTLTASSSLGDVTLTRNVTPAPSTKLVLNGASSLGAGACSIYTVQVQDVFNNPVSQLSPLAITLTGQGSGSFYSDPGCAVSVSSVVIGSASNQAQFYYKANSGQSSLTFAANDSGPLTDATLGVSVSVGLPVKMLLNALSNVLAGQCFAMTFSAVDSLNNQANVASDAAISFSGLGSGSLYIASDCSGAPLASGSLIIPTGQSQVVAYYRNLTAESVAATFTASSLGIVNYAINVNPGAPTKIALSGPSGAQAGYCSGLVARTTDTHGNVRSVSGAAVLNLTGQGLGNFFSDALCATPISNITIAAGSSSKELYFKSNTAGDYNLNVADAGAMSAGTLTVVISPLAATELVLAGDFNPLVQTCTVYSIYSADALNNIINVTGSPLSINLSGQGYGNFYSNAGCTTTVSSMSIPVGQSSVVVYFKSNVAESLSLNFAASGRNTVVRPVTVKPLAPSELSLTGASPIAASSCGSFVLQMRDSLGNGSSLGSDKTVVLGGAGSGSFYADSSCSSAITSVVFTAGTHTKTLYLKSPDALTTTLTAVDSGMPNLTDTSFSLTVTAAGAANPTKLAMNGAANPGINTCAAYAVITQSNSGSSVDVSSDLTISLSGAGGGAFYTDSSCTNAAASVVVSTGSSVKPFYFKTADAGSFLFVASASGLSVATQAVTVSSAGGGGGGPTYVPIKLLVSGPTEVLTSSCGGQYTVSAADSNNQVVPVQTTEVVTLTNGAGNGLFYSDSACSSQITSLTFTAGQSTKNFYFRDTQAESVSLQAYSDNLIYGSLAVQVKSSGRLNLTMNSSAGAVWQNFIYRNRGTISDRTVVLQNVGLTQANSVSLANPAISGAFSFRGGSFPGMGGTCANNSVLLPNQQCSIVVRFQPNSETSFSDNLKITYTVGSNNMEANLPLAGQANSGLNPLAVAAGSHHTCVTLTDMSTKCYGLNGKGQLGIGSTTNYGVSNGDIEKLSWTPFGHFATQIVGGAEHSCALMADGKVICWGDNTYGQLGRGDSVASVGTTNTDLAQSAYTFVNLGTNKTATKISAGAYHTCALLQDGNAKCWGRNNYGQLGREDAVGRGTSAGDMGDNLGNISFGIGQTVVDIASGANHNCVVLQGGQLKCWGRNIFGQLGIGSTADMGDNTGEMGTGLPPVSAHSGATVLSVGAGVDHTCAIITIPTSADPVVKCWGRNDYGQLGIGDALQRGTSPSQMGDALPIVSLGLSGVPKKLALGRVHSCVLLATGSVKCWGSNQYGQLGLSVTTTDHRGDGSNEMGNSLPTLVLGNSVLAADITAGEDHSCVIIDTNKVRCWGRNDNGQLGHRHSAGNIAAWGTNSYTMATLPDSYVNNYSYFEGIALDNKYTCGLSRSENEVMCWGHSAQSSTTHPTKYHDFTSKGGVKQLEAGNGFMCALTKNDNNVYCWGNDAWFTNRAGQASFSYSLPNLAAPTLTGYKKIAAGENFLCGITSADAIKCFGWNIAGILGAAGAGTYIAPASAVTMTIPAGVPADIYAGAAHACAVNASGALSCWGANNFGQLGDASTTNRAVPTAISIGGAAAKVSMGRHHSCVVLTDGAVQCWGDNQYGQLGNASVTTSFNSPQTITLGGTGTAKDLSLGEDSSCAVMSDDKLRCWGRNSKGELAIGSTTDVNSPQATFLGEDFRIFMAKAPKRGQHRCAVGWENTRQVPFQLKCWGDNSSGQLGYGDTADRGHNAATLKRALMPVPQNLMSAMTAIGSVPEIFARSASGAFATTVTASFDDTVYSTPSSSAVTATFQLPPYPTGSSVTSLVNFKPAVLTNKVPSGIRVKLWGGGGGAGKGDSGQMGGNGGAGGSLIADIPANLLTGSLQVWVAGGGKVTDGTSSGKAGSGGGSSAISINGTLMLLAAGGGGGGGTYNSAAGHGGPSETNGTANSGNGAYFGRGATTTAPGAANGSDWGTPTGGSNFSAGGHGGSHTGISTFIPGGVGWSTGGQGVETRCGGGGGGGYHGGGAGGTWSSQSGSGGGGGSNYIHALLSGSTTKDNGTNRTPGNTGDADYADSAGLGGIGSNGTTNSTTYNGGNGRVVIRFY